MTLRREPTEDQARVLRSLEQSRAISVQGVAGSGKTVLSGLAIERYPERSMVISSTRSATAQVNSHLGNDPRDHYVDTSAALAWRLARSCGRYVGLPNRIRIDSVGLKEKKIAPADEYLLSYTEVEEAAAKVLQLPGFARVVRGVYGQVILDEAQDFSLSTLEWLAPLVRNGRSLLMFDENQRLASDAAPVIQMIRDGELPTEHVDMTISLRCSGPVSSAARAVLRGDAELKRNEMLNVKHLGAIGASLKRLMLPMRSNCESVAVLAFQNRTVGRIRDGLARKTAAFEPMQSSTFRSVSEEERELLAAELIRSLANRSGVEKDIAALLVQDAKVETLTRAASSCLGGDWDELENIKKSFSDNEVPYWLSESRLRACAGRPGLEVGGNVDRWLLHRIHRQKHSVPKGTFVATINSAKGREFDGVIMFDDFADLFPSLGESHRRRLAYVGLTRARKQIVIAGPKERATGIFCSATKSV